MNSVMSKNKVIMAIVVLTGGLVIVGNGCSRFLTTGSGDSSSEDNSYRNDTTSDPSATDGNIHVIVGAPTTATVYSKAALESKEFQLGINVTDRTVSTYLEKRGSISSKGDVTTFTPPMGMAITAIVADVCDDLITKQASLQPNQRFFRDFNLTAAGRPTLAAQEYSIRALSLAVWDRQPDAVEIDLLTDLVADAIDSAEENGQRKAALMLCTTINSTTESIVR